VVITGLGWFRDGAYGHTRGPSLDGGPEGGSLYSRLQADGILPGPVPDFGRLSLAAKQICAAVGAGLRDAGCSAGCAPREVIGIIGNGSAVEANRAFFDDYVSNGRQMARGSLFVYTLPSSPLAAPAQCYTLNGPLIHFRHARDGVAHIVDRAVELLAQRLADAMVVVYEDATGILGCVVRPDAEGGHAAVLSAAALKERAGHVQSVSDLVNDVTTKGKTD